MVRSAEDNSKRRKTVYVTISAAVLAIAIYCDVTTSAGNSDLLSEENASSTTIPIGQGASFLPVFTTPVFILILVVGMFSLGAREKWASEHAAMGGVSSAYSVFNEGGKTMAGGMTAKELDGQLRGGPVGGHGNDLSDDIRRSSTSILPMQQRKTQPEGPKDDRNIERQRRERAEAAMRRMKQS
mmetsp:Transcript_33745/g.99414  ORF Transcript_33745/g.99414 Transcript_33745/m.99414 type:complete len:184 (+) Transcript_33745:109-660(+)